MQKDLFSNHPRRSPGTANGVPEDRRVQGEVQGTIQNRSEELRLEEQFPDILALSTEKAEKARDNVEDIDLPKAEDAAKAADPKKKDGK